MKTLRQIWTIAFRECGIMREQPIYWISLVVFPIVVIVFFTSLMAQGVPTDMPVGVVDLDQTATSRAMIRRLDAFQSSQVVAQYQNMNEAREAIQRNEISKGDDAWIGHQHATQTIFLLQQHHVGGRLVAF